VATGDVRARHEQRPHAILAHVAEGHRGAARHHTLPGSVSRHLAQVSAAGRPYAAPVKAESQGAGSR
jgi:hypothetical protein